MIETERLLLRPYELGDFGPYLEMLDDPNMDFPGRIPVTYEDAWHRLQRYVGHWHLLGYGNFAVVDKTTMKYVGETGIWKSNRGLGSDFDNDDEAGWFISGSNQRRGFAFEAALAAHEWYRLKFQRLRTVCMISPDNVTSISLAQKLGYRSFRQGEYKGTAVIFFERCLGGS
jgi:RimJ/RimL family protein N-acetyltransferase